MADCYFNDYDKFVGKHITVIYECGSKCKKLHCKLLKYCEKNSKEKYIILKTHNKIICYMDCNKIIYWIADYKDLFAENQNIYMSNTKPMESNANAEGEDLLLQEAQHKEIVPLEASAQNIQLHEALLENGENTDVCSINSSEENMFLTPNKDITHVELQNNDVMLPENKNKIIDNYEINNNYNKITEKYHKDDYKKSVLRYPLAAFINCNFQGVCLTIYTASGQAISGEVIFNYEFLIVLKSDEKSYYINPEQITYFC